MIGYYLLLNLSTILFPLLLSFDQKVNYKSYFKSVFLSAIIVAIPFIIWDEIFTNAGVWGFNEKYLIGFYIGHLPIEEWLFFITVPFACVFVFQCVKAYFQLINLQKFNVIFWFIIIVYIFVLLYFGYNKMYTLTVTIFSIVAFLIIFKSPSAYFFPLSFILSLIPFVFMNGALTGAFTDSPVVWYNDNENIHQRFWTIPLEDFLYAFTLISSNIFLVEFFQKRKMKSVK